MKTADFDFVLPAELVAQHPADGGRDQSRLLVAQKDTGTVAHRQFYELPELLRQDDLIGAFKNLVQRAW